MKEYTGHPLRLAGRMIVPAAAVLVAGLWGYSGLVLTVLLIFVVVAGTAINLVKLRLSGMFRRLVVSERPKNEIFSAYTANYVLLYTAQFLPAMLAGAFFEGALIIPFAELSLILAAISGTLVGLVARTLGSVHLFAILVTLPLVLLGITQNPVGALFPMGYVIGAAELTVTGIIPFVVVGIAYLGVVMYASRL
ncbi:hypothetical protein J2741_000467 [Methanolinea mesophila]|uniref:hypothetical protein n=1 Tax=Methanolinea mesophila TaxID=547055 RepID=UPI001AE8D554|nr:hypothetical protein [Methanolinea mesophila]MBP1927920.1 hypothetical protein [Methanolinea mesophila]